MKRVFQRIFNWELWPFYVIYTPLGFVWLYYAFKARHFWFFSPVNPTLEFGGFEGETKSEMYAQLPAEYKPKTLTLAHTIPAGTAVKAVEEAGFDYPFIVKPNIGMQGILFRKIENAEELMTYHNHVPVEYLVQEYIDMPMEFSVFHILYPGETKGKVTGFILKDYLAVTGDGKSTLIELIIKDERAKFREEEMRHKHAANLDVVIPEDQKYYLSIAGNHNRGARFINLHKEIDTALCNVFDHISSKAGKFQYGRYDLKCTSIEDLKAGKNIKILEYNGTGAEPNHIYDCNMNYWKALKIVANHWEDLYRIGKINNTKHNVPYWGYTRGRKHLRKAAKFFTELRKYDLDY